MRTRSIKSKIILTISYTTVVVPTFLVALLAVTYYYLGIEKIFSEKITDSINDTVKVATLYLNEHNNNIKTSALMAGGDTALNLQNLTNNDKLFTAFLDNKAKSLGLSDIVVFTEDKKVIGATSLTYSMMFENIEQSIIDEADKGMIMVRTISHDKVQALLRVDKFMSNIFIGKVYMIVGRYVDSKILKHLEATQEQADVYLQVKKGIEDMRRKVISAFVLLSVTFLFLSIFISQKLATFILKPIHDLSDAIKKFKLGQKIIKVQEKTNDDEINILAKSFNRMIDTITSQHLNIVRAKHLIEERNDFIEAMMSELSAGVIVIGKSEKIEICNVSALEILGMDKSILGSNYRDIVPEFTDTVENLTEEGKIASANISIVRCEKSINLSLKAQKLKAYSFNPQTSELEPNNKTILTLDDITAVVAGQRFQAWADIARRVAHEVKNPLTPIQLAVDRLEHKFLKEITSDKDMFRKYIQIINSKVEDIKKMLGDFVEFAVISTLDLKANELTPIIADAIFLQKHQWTDIEYEFNNTIGDCKVLCEKRYITQVMTNLLKNSAESIAAASEKANGQYKGHIKISLEKTNNDNEVIVLVQDNGIGISADILEKICEPYVTTKSTGTGLGLSIVKKIIEEHKGEFQIKNGANWGTIASFNLQIAKK
jgi:two-component system nitrogen regulation sensor histidine kinase NtrY